jgi:hypothetical protein
MSFGSAIHVNDIGTAFNITLTDDQLPEQPIDLTGATTLEFCFEDPDGVIKTRTPTVVNPPGTDGLLQYVTVAADLDVEGPWKLQVHYVIPTAERRADVLSFAVKGNVCA